MQNRNALSSLAVILCRMNNDPLSPILNQLYPGARVHHGFMDQFEAVTDKAANATANIRYAIGPLWAGHMYPHMRPASKNGIVTHMVNLLDLHCPSRTAVGERVNDGTHGSAPAHKCGRHIFMLCACLQECCGRHEWRHTTHKGVLLWALLRGRPGE